VNTLIPPWAIKILVAVAIPGIACVGLYGIDFSKDAGGWRAAMSVTAFPLLLIALIGLCRSLSAQQGSRRASWIWGAWAAVEAAILTASRL